MERNGRGRLKEVVPAVGGTLAKAVATIALYGTVILAIYALTMWVNDSGGGGGGAREAQPVLQDAPSRSDGPHAMRAEAFAAGADMDCVGNDGDGPRYVEGPMRVGSRDPYELDGDGDGVGCDD